MKRAYKLQEFVAHASNVNCLKIGKKSSRVLVTGGEDHKVNMWAIGKPNAILSLSGHSSAVESVTFDSAEALVVAGAASGTIKLWDLEEAKIVRTLTGHRSNCISVDFHPFGEFFASGSLDTNLKIWDIRRKGCIHTYKGHTRGVNSIRFSPDGRWVVSGGEDNIVKLWDLTAGKLMHDFKCHEGQIQCMDFHPQEFLLATGSADRTVKFWDLETFELIGSAGPETTGVRAMIFNPDGRTLLTGLHESLKVFSWEPLRCYDAVDVGWSKLADLNIHEGKLLGCSYNQSCVGVWVVDISRVGPYAAGNVSRTNGHNEAKLASSGHPSVQQLDNNLKTNMARLSLAHSTESGIKEPKTTTSLTTTEGHSSTPQRAGIAFSSKNLPASSGPPSYVSTPKKNSTSRVQPTTNFQTLSRPDIVPVIVPRSNSLRPETTSDAKKEMNNVGRVVPSTVSTKSSDVIKSGSNRDESDKIDSINQKRMTGNDKTDLNIARAEQHVSSRLDNTNTSSVVCDGNQPAARWIGAAKFRRNSPVDPVVSPHDRSPTFPWSATDDGVTCQPDRQVTAPELSKRVVEPGRARALVASWETREKALTADTPVLVSGRPPTSPGVDMNSFIPRGSHGTSESDWTVSDDNSAIEELMQQHNTFTSILQARLTKLQVIRRFWQRNDLKGAIDATGKMGDHSVSADVISILIERSEIFTLDICTVILPLLTRLLQSETDRHLTVAMETLLVLVKTFGDVIRATISATPTIGVDLQAEQRLERCNLCYVELENIKQILVPLIRRGGAVAKSAQELSLALQEV